MKKALISKLESIHNFDGTSGFRVAQVENASNTFDVAEDLYWVDCDDNVEADYYYYDTTSNSILIKPVQETKQASANQPQTSGTTTL